MYDFKDFVRKSSDAKVQTIGVETLIELVKADGFRIRTTAAGTEHVHVLNSENDAYFSIRITDKTPLFKETMEERIVEALGNYVIYAGVSDSGNKFLSFGKPRENDDTPAMSVKDVMAMLKKGNGQPAKVG